MFKIFIGYDSTIDIAYRVLKYSLEKHSSQPLDIRPLVLKDLQFNRPHDPLASTEFTYTRFLVPHLTGFSGTALFMDNDMVCLGDITEVFRLDLEPYWLRVVKHNHRPSETVKLDGKIQTQYPRKNWSSFMLLNCSQLACWSKQAVESQPAKWLHRFEPIPDDKIGDIPKTWNKLDECDSSTKLIHYTSGGPWYPQHRNHPFAEKWFRYRDEYLALKTSV